MIFDSTPWKNSLVKSSQYLNKIKSQRRFGDYRTGREIFISFYAIRKLIESDKLSVEVVGKKYMIISYRFIGKQITKSNWHHLQRHYDLNNPIKEKISLKKLSNQIIHSYVFTFSIKKHGGLGGIFFCSDWCRNKEVYYISVPTLIRIFNLVGEDDPMSMHSVFDAKKGDYFIKLSNKLNSKKR